ncbi:MAG: HEAT repeat domain-containing protein [Proteobacteria bacterium]|nr:HEAT repeat domain-containing protein [Pseudomonadota bacterium]
MKDIFKISILAMLIGLGFSAGSVLANGEEEEGLAGPAGEVEKEGVEGVANPLGPGGAEFQTQNQTIEYIAALGETEGETAYARLMEFANGSNPVNRATAIQALGRRGDQRALPQVVKALGDKNQTVRMFAVISLRALNAKDKVQDMEPLLADPDQYVRTEALRSYLALRGADSLYELTEHLKDPEYRVRAVAAECLGELSKLVGPGKTTPYLIKVLADPNKIVRMYAAQSLGQTGDRQAIGPLQVLLSDPESVVREVAKEALINLGVPAVAQVPVRSQPAKLPEAKLAAVPAARPVPGRILDLVQDDITRHFQLTSLDFSVKGIRLGDELSKVTQALGNPRFQNTKKQTLDYPGLKISYGSDQKVTEIAVSSEMAASLPAANRELLGDRIAQDEQYRKSLLGAESEVEEEEVNVFGAQFTQFTYSYGNRGIKLKITDAKGKKNVAFFTLVQPGQ